ncbi:MAG: 4-hydroxybenzoate octaprenyltransferase [Bacteroidetes bacterium CG_4_8_14_3_um_filter_31_14]|nr:MAG: 4-hydroxybenzoate octaprenyltransferase [Bacteroidetes bacterium CG_4_8_14_3_um_filter_31_14]
MFKFQKYLSLIKFSHTIFAMPFAMVGYFIAIKTEGNSFNLKILLLVILCMVLARSAAMAFNRMVDVRYDRKNPRTMNREIPSGQISLFATSVFVFLTSILFIVTTWFINPLVFYLSPVALIVIFVYSFTKRFTSLCHFVLGLGLALAPIGAYLSVTAHFAVLPILFSFVVLLWVGGFDILYALQDDDFDKSLNLHSIPVKVGRKTSLALSAFVHFIAIAIAFYAGCYGNFSNYYWIGLTIFSIMLIYEHLIVKPNDLTKVNMAFAIVNGVAGAIFGGFIIASLYFF